MTASVGSIGVRLISTDEPGGNPEAAAGFHEKHGQVAASPPPGRKPVRGRLGGAFGPDVAVHSGEQCLIEAREEVENLLPAFARQFGGEGRTLSS